MSNSQKTQIFVTGATGKYSLTVMELNTDCQLEVTLVDLLCLHCYPTPAPNHFR